MSAIEPSSSRLTRLLSYLERDVGNIALRKDAIREACDAGEWDVARRLIEVGLQARPDDPQLLALCGFAHLQALRYLDAEAAFRQALALGLSAPDVHYNLAFAVFMQRRYEDVLGLLAPAVLHAVPLGRVIRARCLHHLQQPEAAIADCQAYLEVAPEHAEANGLLALLLFDSNRVADARACAEAALKVNPKQLEALLALGLIQSADHDYVAAERLFRAALQGDPQCGRAWFGSSLLELQQMNIEAAARDIEIATTHMPGHIGTWHVLAWIRIVQGDVAAAQAAFENALALDRNFGETHGGLAVIAALQEREDAARAAITRAQRLDPDGMAAKYAATLLLQRAGQHEQAQAVLDSILSRPVPDSDLKYRDLITAHIKRLAARVPENSAPTVYH